MTVAGPTPLFGSSEASTLGGELSFGVSGSRPDSRLARRSREARLGARIGVVYGINHSLCRYSLAGRSHHVVDGTKASERMTDLGNASSVDVLRGMTIDDQKML